MFVTVATAAAWRESPVTYVDRAPARARPAILVVSGSFAVVTRLHRVLGAAFELLPRATVDEAAAELSRQAVAALVVEAEDARGVPTAALAMRAQAPRVAAPGDPAHGPRVQEAPSPARAGGIPVIAVVRRSAGWTAATLALLETRPATVVVAEDLDVTSVLRAVSARVGRAAFVEDVWPEVSRVVPAGLLPLARLALERGGAPLTVPAAARALGLHRKTLWSHCRRHGVESVQMLLMWCRVIAAAHALRTSVRSVDAIAQELEFASPTALRNVLRRYLGVTATELRLQGGEALACRAFAAWLAGTGTPMTLARRAMTGGDEA